MAIPVDRSRLVKSTTSLAISNWYLVSEAEALSSIDALPQPIDLPMPPLMPVLVLWLVC